MASASQTLALDPSVIGGQLTLATEEPATAMPEGTGVAIVQIDGPLAQRGQDHLCGVLDGYDLVADRFISALEDPEVGAVVLRIDSPGGDLAGLEEGVRRMVEARDASGKRVFAYVDELAASAAYWIASNVAHRITVPPSGGVGSIGVIGAYVDESKALESQGVDVRVFRDPPGKAPMTPSAPVVEVADAQLQQRVSEGAQRFYRAIAGARRLSQKTVRGMNAEVFYGQRAVEEGLADQVGTFESVIETAARSAAKRSALNEARMKLGAALGLPDDAEETTILSDAVARIEDFDEGAESLGCQVLQLTGQTEADAALAVVEAWRTSHLTAESERAQREAERKAQESAERIALVAQLVEAGWETPGTAWADPVAAADPARRQPAEIFAAMSIAALRARVRTLCAQPRVFQSDNAQPVRGLTLTEAEIRFCEKRGISPETYEKAKALPAKSEDRA